MWRREVEVSEAFGGSAEVVCLAMGEEEGWMAKSWRGWSTPRTSARDVRDILRRAPPTRNLMERTAKS